SQYKRPRTQHDVQPENRYRYSNPDGVCEIAVVNRDVWALIPWPPPQREESIVKDRAANFISETENRMPRDRLQHELPHFGAARQSRYVAARHICAEVVAGRHQPAHSDD